MATKRKKRPNRRVDLSDRARSLLKTLVEHYVREGQPVGSKALARDSGLDLSAATIRNVLCDLESLGLLSSPHTSAGRVPTVQGYRLFVDNLVSVTPPSIVELERLKSEMGRRESIDDLLESVSGVLSEVTRMAGVVMVPRRDYRSLRRIEFLPLADKRVLAILVINEQEVQNRVIHAAREYSADQLQEAANYLNTLFGGKDLQQVRAALVQEMVQTKERMNDMMQTAIEMADKVFERDTAEGDYVLAGQTNLMNFAELSNLDKLRQLFEAFNQKRDILHLLDECCAARSMQVFIGEESGYHALGDCSVITSPYKVDGQVLGVLGVIGPTRMAYERVIPLVDVTAKMLGMVLNQRD